MLVRIISILASMLGLILWLIQAAKCYGRRFCSHGRVVMVI